MTNHLAPYLLLRTLAEAPERRPAGTSTHEARCDRLWNLSADLVGMNRLMAGSAHE